MVDVAVRRQRVGQVPTCDDLPVGGTTVIGVRQGLGINQHKTIFIGLASEVPEAQVFGGRSCASVEAKDERQGVAP